MTQRDKPDRPSVAWTTSSCSTGKRCFESRADGKKYLRSRNGLKGSGLTVYHCAECAMFHMGHLPPSIRRGDASRDDLPSRYGRRVD